MDTIFAEATPPGRGGVSVIRVSGPSARRALQALAGATPVPRKTYLRSLRDGDDLVDRALVIWFEKDHSFTGEEVAEFHLHGAPVIGSRLTAALLSLGLRRAEAGEFSRRAFLNGRMDLAEAEGLADLLSAETEAQRRLAMQAADGETGRRIEELRAKLVRAGALVEVTIDFADEEVPEEIPAGVFSLVREAADEIAAMLKSYPATERLRQGYEVAIIGPPNAGKSTLLNCIARREVALVSDVAGTTRDVLELRTDLRGLPVTFLDTAGLRDSSDAVERLGVERAQERASAADLRIHLSEDGIAIGVPREGDIIVGSKADLQPGTGLRISAQTGDGVEELLDIVYNALRLKAACSGLIGHKRQAEALQRAYAALDDIGMMAAELVAESLRQAASELAAVVGIIGAEDYLDEIFSSFCIGK